MYSCRQVCHELINFKKGEIPQGITVVVADVAILVAYRVTPLAYLFEG